MLFSRSKSLESLPYFEKHENLHVFVSIVLYNVCVGVVSDIQPLAFGSCLYIQDNTTAHIVNCTISMIVRTKARYISNHKHFYQLPRLLVALFSFVVNF